MLTVTVLTCAVLFQFMAAIYALRLIKFTGKAYSWILISVALCLMMIRRIIPLYYAVSAKSTYPVDLPNESIGMVLSLCMFLGIVGIREIFIARRRAENELQTAHQQLLDIIEFMPDATFVIDKDKKIIAWNRAIEEMTGIRKKDILGKGDYAYSMPFYGKHRPVIIDLIGEDNPGIQALYDKYEKIGNNIYCEAFAPGLYNGKGAYVWATASPLLDPDGNRYGAIETVRDITERKEKERALQESERKYRELVEHANSIILHWTRDGRVTFLNEFGQKFFGYSAPEIIGRHVIGTIVPATETNGRDLTALMDQILLDPVAFERNINENMRRNGDRVWIAWTNRIMRDDKGGIAEILSIGTDITELKQAEETIRELNTGLEQRVAERTAELAVAKDQAQAADRIKSAFLASMSHELRTPLNSIIGFTGMVLQGLAGPLNEEQSKQLGMVRGSARHLLDLINDILDISKIEAGQLNIISENFNLRESIEKTVQSVAPLADKKGIRLRSGIEDNVSNMRGDQRRMEQIILNLLSNAVKFTDHGEIRLTCASDNGFVTLTVEDTGIGIRPENMDIIFDAFRQVDTGTARTQEGTGLGLNITKKLVEMMGGSIGVKSEFGAGSAFTITLPIIKEK